MQEKLTALKAVFTAATAAFLVYLQMIAVPLVVLILLMICDYISGMAYAFISHTLSSKTGIRGIIKKLCYLLAVAASMGVDWVISSVNVVTENTCAVAVLVTVWLIINEIIS
ncbi:MAG: phage holin family protein, partial [Clostridia bacterium]|nr:phage holin family protein [Clostridia bacterium]